VSVQNELSMIISILHACCSVSLSGVSVIIMCLSYYTATAVYR